jgi:predicted helicase
LTTEPAPLKKRAITFQRRSGGTTRSARPRCGGEGRQFEQIVNWFLKHAPDYKRRLRNVWLRDDRPDRPSRDPGTDLVAEHHTGGVWAIQAKAYLADHSVTKRPADSFLRHREPAALVQAAGGND